MIQRERGQPIRVTLGAHAAPTVEAFIADRTRHAAIRGAFGSGKTFGVLQRMLETMNEQEPNLQLVRPSRWMVTRTTYHELFGTTIKDFESVFSGLGRMTRGGMEPPTFKFHWRNRDDTETQGEVVFLALDRDDSIGKIRGHQLTAAWVNEASNTPKAVIDTLTGRLGRYPSPIDGGVSPTWSGILLDTNSMDTDHWYYHLAEEIKPSGWRFFSQPPAVFEEPGKGPSGKSAWRLNPEAENLRNLPRGEMYYLDGIDARSDDWIRVYYANQYGFTVDGKPVHPEYVDSVHCAPEPIPVQDSPIFLGQDYGRTPGTVVAQYDKLQDRYLFIDEFYDENVSAQSYAPELKRWLDRTFPGLAIGGGWGDPSGSDGNQSTDITPIQIMNDHGIPVEPAPTQDPLLRRGALSAPMRENAMDGRPRLLISPKCKMLRKGLMGGFCYRRMRLAGEYYTEKPDKNEFSHVSEAAEYLCLGMGESTAPRNVAYTHADRAQYAIQ